MQSPDRSFRSGVVVFSQLTRLVLSARFIEPVFQEKSDLHTMLGSDKVMFARPDNEDRTRRFPNDFFCGSAKENMLHPGMTVCCDDDEIDPFLIRILVDLVEWFSRPDGESRLDARADLSLHERLQFLASAKTKLFIDVGKSDLSKAEVGGIDRRFDDIEKIERSAELFREGSRVLQSILRVIRKIDRDKNSVEMNRCSFSR
jgi:hypothetical protein